MWVNYRAAHGLQLARSLHWLDHAPVQARIVYRGWWDSEAAERAESISRRAAATVERSKELKTRLRERAAIQIERKATQLEWCWREQDVDGMCENLNVALREAVSDLLPEIRQNRRCYGDERLAEAERGHRELKKRHRTDCERWERTKIKERAWWAWKSITEEMIDEKKLRKMRRMCHDEWRATLARELRGAEQRKDHSSMWQISREMTAKGLLPRKRWKYDPPQGCPRLEEWTEQLKKGRKRGRPKHDISMEGSTERAEHLMGLGQEVVAPMSAEQFAEHEQWEKGIGVG